MSDPTYKALLIGNSTFPSDPHNLQSLEGPVNDISVLRDALTDTEVGLFEPTAVRMLPERTMSEILIELETFFGSATRDDRLLLYYSGHGLLTDENRLLLCARDTRTDLVKSTSVSATAINDMIEGSPARTTIIVLDCCYSGAFKGANLPDSLKGNGRFLLTSTRSSQLANDATRRNGTSLFTQHLVDGLLKAVPDTNGDGFVELGEVYDYVHDRLVSEGRQIPQRSFAGGGSVAVARRPRELAAAEGGPPSVFQLSQSTLEIDDVEPGEALPPEQIYVLTAPGESCDFSVSTEAEWIEVKARDGYFSLVLHPQLGTNRANVVVRERQSGSTKTLRVRVRVGDNPSPADLTYRREVGASGVAADAGEDSDPESDGASGPGALLTRVRLLGRNHALALAGLAVVVALAALAGLIVTRHSGGSSSSVTPVSGPAAATLNLPDGIAVDAAGVVYVADSGHNRVRRIGLDGRASTVAGHGGDDPAAPAGTSSTATSSSISGVSAVAVDGSGTLYVALGSDGGVATVTPEGALSTVPIRIPGGSSPMVSAMAFAPDGRLVMTIGNDVFRLEPGGDVVLVAGSGVDGYSGDGGPAAAARLSRPSALTVDGKGEIYIADTGNNRVRLVRSDGTIVTVAGVGTSDSAGNGGPAVAAAVSSPSGLALDDKANLYIASSNQVRRVGTDGTISLVAGRPDDSAGFGGDNGPGTAAVMRSVAGVARDLAANLYVSDSGNDRVRKIAPDGTITTIG